MLEDIERVLTNFLYAARLLASADAGRQTSIDANECAGEAVKELASVIAGRERERA